jgi:hypothetical protein
MKRRRILHVDFKEHLKGALTRYFRPLFFSSNNFPLAPDTRAEYGFEFAKIIDKVCCTSVSMTALYLTQQCQLHRCACHSGVIGTAVQPTFISNIFANKSTPVMGTHSFIRYIVTVTVTSLVTTVTNKHLH